jgi:hypothetical protein
MVAKSGEVRAQIYEREMAERGIKQFAITNMDEVLNLGRLN